MKKTKLFLSLLALSAVLGFASCTKKPKATSKTDTTITQTTEEKCTVSFDSNGGTNVVAVKVTKGGKLTAPTAPTKVSDDENNYSFDGWYKDQALNQAFDFSKDTITKDTTLYAKWNATPITKYTVTFETNGGSNVTSQHVKAGGKVVRPETDPTKDADDDYTYEFENWYKDQALNQAFDFSKDTISKDTTLYAKWTSTPITKYTVTFETNGGSDVTSQQVKVGGKAVRPETDPTKDADQQYTYTFAGWYSDAACTQEFDFSSPITSATTIYAKWSTTTNEYTVTFNTNGGTTVNPQTIAYGSKVTEPTAPTRDADSSNTYEFAGWYRDAALNYEFDFNSSITGATTIYAKWDATPIIHSATVDYTAHVISGTYATSLTGDANNNIYLPFVIYSDVEVGYRFLGYSTNPNATTADYAGGTVKLTDDTTFYAIFKKVPIITYDFNGSGQTAETVSAGENGYTTIRPEAPTRTGAYKFLGWSTNKNATTGEYQPSNYVQFTEDTTLYAIWSNKVAVTLDLNGGVSSQLPASIEVVEGSATLPTYAPGKANARFLGWSARKTADDGTWQPGDTITRVTGDLTIYAIWQQTVTVYVRPNNYNHIGTRYVKDVGDSLTLRYDNEKQHYTFAGWQITAYDNTGAQISGFENKVDYGYELEFTEDMTTVYVDGLWTGKKVTVQFERNISANVVTGWVSNINTRFGETFTIPDGSSFVSDNYEFIGWHWGEFDQNYNDMPTDISIDFAIGDEVFVDDYHVFEYPEGNYMFIYAVFREKGHTYETSTIAPTLEFNGKTTYTCTDDPKYSYETPITNDNIFAGYISNVEYIAGRGVTLYTTIMQGKVSYGDEVSVVLRDHSVVDVVITGVKKNNSIVETASKGETVGLILRSNVITDTNINIVGVGGVVCAKGEAITDVHTIYVKARLLSSNEGGRHVGFTTSYQPMIKVETFYGRTTIAAVYNASSYEKLADNTFIQLGKEYIFKLESSTALNAWIGEDIQLTENGLVIGEGKIIARTDAQAADYFENNIIVTLYEDGGAPLYVAVKKGTRWVDIECPFTKEGYRFIGWLNQFSSEIIDDPELIDLVEFENLYEGTITRATVFAPGWVLDTD